MKVLPKSLHVLRVTPISRGPTVEMVDAKSLVSCGVVDRAGLELWCSDFDALVFDVPPDRFALDVAAAYALGKGYLRCVFVHESEKHLRPEA